MIVGDAVILNILNDLNYFFYLIKLYIISNFAAEPDQCCGEWRNATRD